MAFGEGWSILGHTESPIIYYLPKTTHEFFIVMQSPFQKRMLQHFSHNGVCMDSTHGTTGYDFLLNTDLVIDEIGILSIQSCGFSHFKVFL